MPKEYEEIRDKIAGGAKVDSPKYNQAQSEAAAIYNKQHPGHPMGNDSPHQSDRHEKAMKSIHKAN